MTLYYIAAIAAYVALGFMVGLGIGDWSARRDRRDTIARRQVLSQLLAVANTRGGRL